MNGIEFTTTGFRDNEAVIAENINRIEGKALLEAFRGHAVAQGVTCEEVFHEDFGWAMEARLGADGYLCGACVQDARDDVPGEGIRPPNGTEMTAMLWANKDRSLKDRLLGRNKQMPDDPMVAVIRSFLAEVQDCRDLQQM